MIFFLLKVRNPEKYNWDPKWLLSHLVDIYVHLDSDTLAAALANDQRSFSMETFQGAIMRIQKNLSMSPSDVEKFKALGVKAQQITIDNMKKDEEYEDAPDDFLGKFIINMTSRFVLILDLAFRPYDVWTDGGPSASSNVWQSDGS